MAQKEFYKLHKRHNDALLNFMISSIIFVCLFACFFFSSLFKMCMLKSQTFSSQYVQ